MNDDIRRAFDDLVGTPPVNLGRRGAVMSRINRVHHRRRVAVQATLSACLIASAAFGTSRVISATPTSGADRLLEQPPPVAEEGEKTVPIGSPTPKPGKPDPKKQQQPGPGETKAPSTAPDDGEPKPVDPDEPASTKAPDEPDEPDPTATTKPKPTATKDPVVTGDPLHVEFWPYTDAVAGQPMDWKVKAYDGAGALVRITVVYGDGKQTVYEPAEACGAGVNVKKFFTHTYAAAGTYTGKATVTTGGCGAATETKTVSETVKVLAAGSGNGPAKPTVSAQQVAAELAKLALHGADADGFVKKFWVDWGDGSPESVVGPRSLDECAEGAGSTWDQTATHDYAEPGSYTVKVTVMSVNCDAGQAQTATFSLTVTV